MRLVAALLCVGLVSSLSASDPPKPNYHPLAKGTKWEYRISCDSEELHATAEITESVIQNGKTHARVVSKFANGHVTGEDICGDHRGLFRTAYFGMKLADPLPILKYPVKAQQQWTDNFKLGPLEGTVLVVIKDVATAVEVPAGKFTALVVESTFETNGEKQLTSIWYANEVGIVKQETSVGDKTLRMELKKFTPAR